MKIIFVVEGESEKNVIKSLSFPGSIIKCNLWEKNFKKHIRKCPKRSYVIFIFDTDIIDKKRLKTFKDNITLIKNSGVIYSFLPQVKHLEDELIRACNSTIKNKKQLKDAFKASGNNDCKSEIISLGEKGKLSQKLNKMELNLEFLWNEPYPAELKEDISRTDKNANELLKKLQ